MARLTPREWQIATLAASGLGNKEIASTAGISIGTVKVHLHSIFSKLRVENRTQMAARVRDLPEPSRERVPRVTTGLVVRKP